MNRVLLVCLLALISFVVNGQQKAEKNFRSYFQNSDNLSQIEGIWEVDAKQEFYHYDTLYNVNQLYDTLQAVIRANDDRFTAFYLNGDSFNIEFTTTDVKGVYMFQNHFPLTTEQPKKQAVICTHGKMEFTYDLPREYAISASGESYLPNMRVVNVLRWKKIFPDK